MNSVVPEYLAGAGLLIGILLLLKDPSATSKVINSMSGFNTNAILALQGRNPTPTLG